LSCLFHSHQNFASLYFHEEWIHFFKLLTECKADPRIFFLPFS
jgi:hypothetical protein